LKGHTANIFSINKITDSIIASASDDKSVILWNINDYTNITKLFVNISGFRSISYSFDLDILVAGQSNGFINVWHNFSKLILTATIEKTTSLPIQSDSATFQSTFGSIQPNLITQQQSSTIQFDIPIESKHLFSSFKNNFNSFFSNLLS